MSLRKTKRVKLTRSEVKKQTKVISRYHEMVGVYKFMGLSKLEEIKGVKRSKTDQHAYTAAVLDLTQIQTETLQPNP